MWLKCKLFLGLQYKCKKFKRDGNLHVKRLPGGPLGFGFDNCHNIITLRETDGEKQTEKENLNFYCILYIERQVRWDKTARILCSTFFNLSIFLSLRKEVSFPCFISLPKPLKIWYSWQYFTSGCAFKISAIVWSTDPVVVVVMRYLAPREKDTML